jgi:hypothetical protein
MKKIISFLLFCTLAVMISRAQTVPDTLGCDVPDRDTTEFENLPWFSDNQYLENLLDSIGYNITGSNARIIGPAEARFKVPIKFWVYRRSNGTGGPTLANIQAYMNNLNRFYNVENRTLIGFYMRCNITFIDNDASFNVESDGEARGLLQNNKERGCINVHIAQTISDGSLGVHYRARFFGIDGIMLSERTYTNGDFVATFSHEVGHYFELDHTHQYFDKGRCRREAIDRNRTWPTFNACVFRRLVSSRIAETTGDGLRDTPADPELNGNAGCIFNTNGAYNGRTDLWGDSYAAPPAGSAVPDTRNIMSYNGTRVCRNLFSRLQIAVMLYSLTRGKNTNNRLDWQDARGEYDSFEMDDFAAVARPIAYHEAQERNFHQQYYGDGIWGPCDVDWVSFTPTCGNLLTVETYAMAGRTNANTRLTLFDANLTQLAQNDDISATNLFSSFSFNFVAGQQYLIRVENMAPSVTGYYTLQIGRMTLVGSTAPLCGSRQFSVTGLPAGINPTWTLSPPSIGSVSATGLVTAIGSGPATLTATMVVCGQTVQLSQVVQFGTPNPTNLRVIGHCASGPNCGRAGQVIISCSAVTGATQYRWYINNVLQGTTTIPQYSVRRTFTCNEYVEFSVQANGSCGWSATASSAFVYTVSCGFRIATTPNPAQSVLNISLLSETAKTGALEKGNIQITLYDAATKQPVKYWHFAAGQTQFRLNVATLRKGSYIVEVDVANEKKTSSVVIN